MAQDAYEKLYLIAEAQAGYFTTAQAQAAGVSRSLLAYHVASGRILRARRRVYRLALFPASPHEDLFVAWLEAGPRAVISHESALALYGLSDALPTETHVTVPRTASQRKHGMRLHTKQLAAEEMSRYAGLPVTTVPRTIVDVASAGLAPELVERAVREAIFNGLVTPAALLAAAGRRSRHVAQLIQQALSKAGAP
jgi:predicted transcriptional regulator of viral defense system